MCVDVLGLCQFTSIVKATYLNDVEGMEDMYSAETTSTKKLDGDTVETAEKAILPTEFATVVSGNAPALQTNEFVEEHLPFLLPQ